jgi:hypothetical protein
VITGRTPGVQDYFAEDALFFFDLGNAADLARSIVYVFNHPDDVDKVLKRGQEVYLTHRWSEERRGFISRTAELLSGISPRR